MQTKLLGRVPFARALQFQEEAWRASFEGGEGTVLGFESDPTITLGVRSSTVDVIANREDLQSSGFTVCDVDRGGQATLHNPGQLVIFPVMSVRDFGARRWVELLAEVTRLTLEAFGKNVEFDCCRPGLYSEMGKVAAIGLRVRRGISTHGVAINVTNNLADFAMIRACGVRAAPMDQLGTFPLELLFECWTKNFSELLTSSAFLPNLKPSQPFVRS